MALNWRWISLINVRPITPTCASTRSGSATVPTAAFSTPRIHPRNIRTSIPSISSATIGGSLWQELKGVVEHWIGEGVRIFRVDNPQTKPFPFWEWLIGSVKREHPEIIFLAEAFTRPKIMHRLAKLGFTQSYTYFTWRNTKQELIEYFTELASTSRANISGPIYGRTRRNPAGVPAIRRSSGLPVARRLWLRRSAPATAFTDRLTSSWNTSAGNGQGGIPRFGEIPDPPMAPERPDSLSDYIARLNHIRRENPPCNATPD